MTKAHSEADLLAYLDDALSAVERAQVEAHLASCAACREELEVLQALRANLDITFNAALTPIHLPRAAEERIRGVLRQSTTRPRWWWALRLNWGLAAQAVLALFVLVFAANLVPVFTAPQPISTQETLVLGQNRLAPGSAAALRVVVRDRITATPVPGAEVAVGIGKAPGLAREVYRGMTDAAGTAAVAFTVPADLEGMAELHIKTTSAGNTETFVHPITVARTYRVLLMPDKSAYRPGETIHLRVVVLDAVTLRPASSVSVTFSIQAATGQVIARETRQASEFGVAFANVVLPTTMDTGTATLRATVGDTVSERAVFVEHYTLPAFRITIVPEQPYVSPGARVKGIVDATTFYGKTLAGASVNVRGYTQAPRQLVAQSAGTLDSDGRFVFDLALPASYGAAALYVPLKFDIEAEVLDAAGQREGLRHTVLVAAQPLIIRAVPESGRLKPGVENALYVLVAYPDGTPAPAMLRATLPGSETIVETDAYGLAVLRFTPGAGSARVELAAQDADGRTGQYSFDMEVGAIASVLLLRAERAVYEVGETLKLETLVAGLTEGTPVYLDILRANQTVATLSAPVQGGHAIFALDLDATLTGSLQLHAYALPEKGTVVEDTRWVLVEPAQRLTVTVAADRNVYAPAETAHLTITTALQGAPLETALGISLVDASVYALETRGADFARLDALLAQELLAQTTDATAVAKAQDVAARATWANAPKAMYSLEAQQALRPTAILPARGWINRLALTLMTLSVLLGLVVARGLRAPSPGTLCRAWQHMRWSLLALALTAPLWGAAITGGMWLLVQLIGAWALLFAGIPVAGLLAALAVHSWQRRDARLQTILGLTSAYLLLGLALTLALVRGGTLIPTQLVGVIVSFLLLIGGLGLLGQSLILTGRRRAGWAITALALLLILLLMTLALIPDFDSPLTATLGDPALYAGPIGWLTGCAAKMPTAEPTFEAVEQETRPPMATTEVPTEATTMPTPVSTPMEPFPLRQVVPETLYWNPDVLTGEDGAFSLEIALPEKSTAWRGTILASSLAGDIGATTFEIRVGE